MARFPIFNGFLQSDLDANGFKILNLTGIGNNLSGTILVDPQFGDDTLAAPESSVPFKTLAAALAVAPSGFNITMRPGNYFFDGQLEVARKVNIFGYGAVIGPVTPGTGSGLLITASGVEIYGIVFDGGVANVDAVNDDSGVISIEGRNALIRDVGIINQNGVGIELIDHYDGITIETTEISSCYRAITCAIGTTSIQDINIRANVFGTNRHEGVKLTGIDNAGGVALREVRIQNNEFVLNNADNQNKAAINIDHGAIDVLVTGNYISGHYGSIAAFKILRGAISGNVMTGADNYHLAIVGHQKVNIIGNIVDCANPSTGAPLTITGISVTGDYAAANDSGPMMISGNQITNVHASGMSIVLSNVNDVNLTGNEVERIQLIDYLNLQTSGNEFKVAASGPAILLATSGRTSQGFTASANRFRITGSAPARLIATSDAGALGISGVHIVGNSSTPGLTYSGGIFGNSSGSAATNVYISANTPPSVSGNPQLGWVNDEKRLPNQVIVSQIRGNNAMGIRESDAYPFLTIAAAVTAATAGDTVYVKDGVFDELIHAKNGITVRFAPEATLVCVNANGCVVTDADASVFSLYHEHAAIKSSKAGQRAITIGHTGTYFFKVGGILNTGTNTGTICNALHVTELAVVTVEITSDKDFMLNTTGIVSTNAHAISNEEGIIKIKSNSTEISSAATSAILDTSTGFIHVEDAHITADGDEPVIIDTSVATHVYKRCTIQAFGTGFAAVQISGTATHTPTFRDCVLISEATATQSINCSGAHNVQLLGTMQANKGASPPTNVTFVGGGTYTVDAGVFSDWY